MPKRTSGAWVLFSVASPGVVAYRRNSRTGSGYTGHRRLSKGGRTVARRFVIWGGAAGFLGVAAGAFGAHALRGRLSPDLLEVFRTGAHYQMLHALALVACGWAAERFPGRAVRIAGGAFAVGIVLFSGSLYLLALTGIRALGAVTPLGGLGFLVGWGALLFAAASGGRQGA